MTLFRDRQSVATDRVTFVLRGPSVGQVSYFLVWTANTLFALLLKKNDPFAENTPTISPHVKFPVCFQQQ